MHFNLRHLRVLASVVKLSSITRAAAQCRLSQPAVTQAINNIERDLETVLFDRTSQGVYATETGLAFARRTERALSLLDEAFRSVAPRLQLTATASQLQALIAVRDAGNFTLAARRIGIAQPTVHRAVSQLEIEATRPLFERTSTGILATRFGQTLADAACLAFAELAQARMELAEIAGREAGRIVIGAMPLSRAFPLPRAIAQFRERWPRLPLRIVDGPYDELISGLRHGEIDFLVGALRNPAPIGDVEEAVLFEDQLAIVARPNHPLIGRKNITVADLKEFPFVVAAAGTPTRAHFDRLFGYPAGKIPDGIVESGSLILVRELLAVSDHLGCVSRLQAEAEVAAGRIAQVEFRLPGTSRAIGITTRRGWQPTGSQIELLSLLRDIGS
jgi:LysR family transcriptional regulator, regulator for genes of the gallate degradation pathway